MEATWVISWDQITYPEINVLQVMEYEPFVTIDDPFNIANTGYIESIDFEGLPGQVDEESGEPLYAATLVFQVVRMDLPSYIPKFPEGTVFEEGTPLGVTRSGRPPAVVRGNRMHVARGHLAFAGGDADPWGDTSNPPPGDEFPRPVRSRIISESPIPARWIELPSQEIPKGKGTIYMSMKPMGDGIIYWGDTVVQFVDPYTFHPVI